LGHQTCKNRRPYNLYCVGADVKPCSINLQGVHVWAKSLQREPEPVCPSKWGWVKKDDQWTPVWMTLPEVSKVCRELIHCCCKKGCASRYKCVKANLTCTALCRCDNECNRE